MNDRELFQLATILILCPLVVLIFAFACANDLPGGTFFLATGISFLLFSSGLTLAVYLGTRSIPIAFIVLFAFWLTIGLFIYDLLLRLDNA